MQMPMYDLNVWSNRQMYGYEQNHKPSEKMKEKKVWQILGYDTVSINFLLYEDILWVVVLLPDIL